MYESTYPKALAICCDNKRGNEMKKQKVNSNGDSVISRVANTHICPHCGAKLSRLTGKCTVCGWKKEEIETSEETNVL